MFRPFKPLCCGVLLMNVLIGISACHTRLNLSTQSVPNPSTLVQNQPLTPPQFELKPISENGGYFCSNGETALGPISRRMVQKCRDWGGGSSCDTTEWSEALFLKAYGTERCPDGSRLNSLTGYCIEGRNVLGPFPQKLVTACENLGGGTSCQSSRWDADVFHQVLRSQGMLPVPTRKPPQFVLLAFDGSESIEAWNKSRNFTKAMKQQGTSVHFTYFISGVYFVSREHRNLYNAPAGKGKGRSAIGWGGSAEEVQQRLEQLNLAHQEGHEIASHAVGHFNGQKWSEADWTKEFDYFDQFIFESHKINGLSGSLIFDRDEIEGFRAPELGKSAGLYKTLQKQEFRYDTSKEDQAGNWPEKQNGVWNFPLVSLKTALTRKNTLSMDYNFYMAHSRARPNAANAKQYEEDTFQTYLNYFKSNYDGNRAPVHIGHHFSAWNGGAYWNALFRFAESVCGLAEVRCVTYRELADFMDLLTPEQIASYQKGNFSSPVSSAPPGNQSAQSPSLGLSLEEHKQLCQP
ncbi:MAG: polysaccharide deacetylase family protein [Microcoleaceae cyanobacterium]